MLSPLGLLNARLRLNTLFTLNATNTEMTVNDVLNIVPFFPLSLERTLPFLSSFRFAIARAKPRKAKVGHSFEDRPSLTSTIPAAPPRPASGAT